MRLFDGGIFGGGGVMTTSWNPVLHFMRSPVVSTPSLSVSNNFTGGEVVVIGGLIAALVAVGKWLFDEKVEEAKTEGIKEGYEKASRECEAKLREQADAFRRQLEALKDDIDNLKQQRDKAMKIAEKASQLLGEFEGCINGLKGEGITPDDKTMKDYQYLSDFIRQLKDAKAA